MSKLSYIHVLSPGEGQRYSSFYIYLPAGDEYYSQYRFIYMNNPIDPSLDYFGGTNNAANCEFFRIREVYIGKLDGEKFLPGFRALQGGEIGFTFREQKAGDFSGGFHGDEVLCDVSLCADGVQISLDRPFFGSFDVAEFEESSYIFRCNTPSDKLVFHKQKYVMSGNTVNLSQYIEWVGDAKPLVAAYSPMLTVQRLDPKNTERILTDTVEFYSTPGGELLTVFDTTPYGSASGKKFSENFCENTLSTAVKVYGKNSGFTVEGGYSVVDESIPKEQISTMLCVRYSQALDNKIYFNIGDGTAPKAGTVWKSDIYYRLKYVPQQ